MGAPAAGGFATALGAVAVALWALLATLTAATGAVPPFQFLAMTFAIGTLVGAARWLRRPAGACALRQPMTVWAVGVGGLFGFHALYFAALKLAPPAEASLLNYLWPLLIVLFSSLLPGERLRLTDVAGAALGFAGVLVLVLGRARVEIRADHAIGYALALACAFVWAGYSVLSRRFAGVPTDAVTGFCAATALLAIGCHVAFERWVWPAGARAWLAILATGLGPVGAAFYLWDVGCKRGDIRFLGTLAYAIPVASTLILVGAGYAEPTLSLAASCALIVSAALVASWRAGTR